MAFQKFEGPFMDAEFLGLRDLLCGERLVLDLIEHKRIKPSDEPPPGVSADEYYLIEVTDESRVWRLTYDRPYAVKFRDCSLKFQDVDDENWPYSCLFSEKSEWLDELVPSAQPSVLVPTHYVFVLLKQIIEILGDRDPQVEQILRDQE